jgi:hypothetical protein
MKTQTKKKLIKELSKKELRIDVLKISSWIMLKENTAAILSPIF